MFGAFVSHTMKTPSNILAVIGALIVTFNAGAQTQEPVPVLQAFPTAEVLGPAWKREIDLLFDPASNPAEICTSTVVPDSWKKAKREAVENPTNQISGWSHAHFDFYAGKETNRYIRYEVQVDRNRSKQQVIEVFNRLLTLDRKEYQKKEIKGLGEAAVVYWDGSGVCVWFRRGAFVVWISPMNMDATWENDPALQQLAKALDERLDARIPDKKTRTESKGAREKK